ncbi:DUF982 domain-containing protein [Neorhizobium sp. CSC1952]|uniref:DUF982 domain-containing protein n=1 Tax=Neorhizobium sp. CSC1952 TaxID=2978974 RepID=UPI0025A56EC7|nr:DUF982 domain-containing protein [Rhizobium sp. CSC1952]WJR67005.1 DUF982 domain-containing protein [Rhizobium sp. CSC1952]
MMELNPALRVVCAAMRGVEMISDVTEANEALWSAPVRVRVGYGFPETIRGPREALEYLKWRWPVREGTYYIKALKECAACLQRRLPLEKVRETFVLASIEAKMLS